MRAITERGDISRLGLARSRMENQAADQPDTRGRVRLPFLAKLALIALLIPAYFSIGSLTFTPSKALFLVLVPVLTVNLLRGAYGRLFVTDFLIFGFAAWMTMAMFINHAPRVAIEFSGSNTIIILGGYLTARATIRDRSTFIGLIRFLALVIVLSLPFALYEVITSKTTIPRWIGEVSWLQSYPDINHDPRLGLWRAQVVFQHPIHYGLFCSLAFSLVFVGLAERIPWFRRTLLTGAIGLGCFFSVSSGPVLAMMTQLGLIGWSAALKRVSRPWLTFVTLGIAAYVVLEILSNRPAIYAIVSRISFSSQTAFARRVLFNYGTEQVGRAPVFGIGDTPWPLPTWMTGSVDNFWLLVAIRFGVPAFVLLLGAFVLAMVAAGLQNYESDRELAALRRSWIFTLVSIVLILCTVAIWGEVYSIILFMLGSGMWFATAAPALQSGQDAPDAADPPLRYSRFPPKAVARTPTAAG